MLNFKNVQLCVQSPLKRGNKPFYISVANQLLKYIIIISSSNIAIAQKDSYVCLNNNALYKMDALQCDTQFIGYSGVLLTDIAITPSRKLYGIDFYKLYEIDTLNAATTYINDIDPTGVGFNALVALNDDYLLGVRVNTEIIKISTLNGATSLVGTCGYLPAGDITFYKGYFYMADYFGGLIRIELSNNYNTIISSVFIGTMNTPYSSPYGILAIGDANCVDDNLKLLAFEGYQIYEVNPNNASCTLVCDSIYESLAGATGATSLTETQFQGYGGILELPNIFTPNGDDINDYFSSPYDYGIKNVHVDIFDRWGNVIFSSDGDNLNWDGKNKNGQPCSDGVYYYLINYINYCDKKFSKKGFIQLIR